uniref:Uncharacterized protein n=1 Tax=Alexandrium catenella TaxID=2925 RepID=A0A6T9D4K8_ALECA
MVTKVRVGAAAKDVEEEGAAEEECTGPSKRLRRQRPHISLAAIRGRTSVKLFDQSSRESLGDLLQSEDSDAESSTECGSPSSASVGSIEDWQWESHDEAVPLFGALQPDDECR